MEQAVLTNESQLIQQAIQILLENTAQPTPTAFLFFKS